MGIKTFENLQVPLPPGADGLRVVAYGDARLGQRRIVVALEGIKAGRAKLGGPVTAQQHMVEKYGDFWHYSLIIGLGCCYL